ncbi:MAG: alpha-galactosidase [Bacillota bacterium]
MKQADSPRMECHPGGRYAIHFAGGRLSGLIAAVEVAGPRSKRRLSSTQGVWSCPTTPQLPMQMEAQLEGGLTLELTGDQPPEGAGLLLTVRLHNRGSERVRIHRLFPLLLDEESALTLSLPSSVRERRWGVYKQGYQSWSYAGWLPLDTADVQPRFFMTRPVQGDPAWPLPERGRFQSEGMLMLGCAQSGPVLLAGFTGGRRLLGRFELTAAPAQSGAPTGVPVAALEAWCEADGIGLDPGQSITTEPLLVAVAPEQEALDSYARLTGRQMEARVPARAPAVWCSWYSSYTKVREIDMLEATIALQGRRETHPVDVIQLDDGYMRAVGDWLESNSRFPHGLGWLANQIRQAGFIPGLWLAPFVAQRRSRLFQQHRDWFVKGVDGVPLPIAFSPDWSDRYYGLDLTHPEVQQWLADLIRKVVSLGFGYLKLDFLFGGAMAGIRYDPQVPRAAALRKGLEIIREAAGEETFLLGCGVPMLPAVGLVDAMRIGPDTAASWNFRFKGLPILQDEPGVPALKNALRNTLTRQWMNGRLWLNDPDSQILREHQTSLTTEEVKTSLLVSTMTGGLLSFSDCAEKISPERLNWLRRATPPAQPWLQPVTLLGEEVPFLSTGWQGAWLIALAVNATDQPRPLRLKWASLGLEPQTACHLYDTWTGEYLGARVGEFVGGLIPPHGSRVLALRPASGLPEVVGASFHVSPAQAVAAEERQEGALVIRLGDGAHGPGQVTLAVPPPYQVGKAQVEGANLLGQKNTLSNSMVLDLVATPGSIIRIGYR